MIKRWVFPELVIRRQDRKVLAEETGGVLALNWRLDDRTARG